MPSIASALFRAFFAPQHVAKQTIMSAVSSPMSKPVSGPRTGNVRLDARAGRG
jgi:hypothetical protein